MLGVLAQAEAARNTGAASEEFRSKVMDDLLWAMQHALTTVALRKFRGREPADFVDEVFREFRKVISWAISTGSDKSAKYDPGWDDGEPQAITAPVTDGLSASDRGLPSRGRAMPVSRVYTIDNHKGQLQPGG